MCIELHLLFPPRKLLSNKAEYKCMLLFFVFRLSFLQNRRYSDNSNRFLSSEPESQESVGASQPRVQCLQMQPEENIQTTAQIGNMCQIKRLHCSFLLTRNNKSQRWFIGLFHRTSTVHYVRMMLACRYFIRQPKTMNATR